MTLDAPKRRVTIKMSADLLVALLSCFILPLPTSGMEEILTVTGPAREAPVMEDSDKGSDIQIWRYMLCEFHANFYSVAQACK